MITRKYRYDDDRPTNLERRSAGATPLCAIEVSERASW